MDNVSRVSLSINIDGGGSDLVNDPGRSLIRLLDKTTRWVHESIGSVMDEGDIDAHYAKTLFDLNGNCVGTVNICITVVEEDDDDA